METESSHTSSSAPDTPTPPSIIEHKMNKMDTLPGLAIRYGVSIADIKRANGLLSDTAMFGRETLLIPTKAFQIGEQVQHIFAQLMSGVGRDRTLDAEAQLHPASSAVARIARQLNVVNGSSYPEDQALEYPWLCQCGTCALDIGNLTAENSAFLRNRTSSCSGMGGDVELTSLSSGMPGVLDSSSTMFMPPSTAGSSTRMHELMRRRHLGHDNADSDGGGGWNEDEPSERGSSSHSHHPTYSLHHATTNNSSPSSHLRGRPQPGLTHPCEPVPHQPGVNGSSNGGSPWQHTQSPHGGSSGGGGRSFRGSHHHSSQQQLETIFNWKALATLGRTIGESAIVQKIKAAASQPALANGASARVSLLDAADGVLASLVPSAKSGSTTARQTTFQKLSEPVMSRSSSQMNVRLKEGAKQE